MVRRPSIQILKTLSRPDPTLSLEFEMESMMLLHHVPSLPRLDVFAGDLARVNIHKNLSIVGIPIDGTFHAPKIRALSLWRASSLVAFKSLVLNPLLLVSFSIKQLGPHITSTSNFSFAHLVSPQNFNL